MKIILINGKKRHGKNTVADIIKRFIPLGRSVIEVGNADEVREIAKRVFNWDGVKDDKGNKLLINVTDAGYNYDPFFWEKKSRDTIEVFKTTSRRYPDYVLVPDWRYKSTYDYWAHLAMTHDDISVTTIQVFRPNFDNEVSDFVKSDKSENMLFGFPFDYKIINEGDLDTLRGAVRIITENITK